MLLKNENRIKLYYEPLIVVLLIIVIFISISVFFVLVGKRTPAQEKYLLLRRGVAPAKYETGLLQMVQQKF